MSFSRAPSNTGVAIGTPRRRFSASSTRLVVVERLDRLLVARRRSRSSFSRSGLASCCRDDRLSTASPTCRPRPAQAQPRCVSRICPTFMRLGTPSGFSTMSTGVPSSRNGMSSCGTMRETTPLLPWRPAILSPGWILRFTATKTLTIFITPGGSSSPRCSFSTLSRKRLFEALLRLVVLLAHRLDLGHRLVVFERERPPLRARELGEDLAR